VSFLDSLVDNARDAYCSWLSAQDNLVQWGQDAFTGIMERTTGGFIQPIYPPNVARFWYQLLCNRPAPPWEAPRWTGGQCPCDQYFVRLDYTVYDNNGTPLPRFAQGTFFGPILDVTFEINPDPNPFKRGLSQVLCRGRPGTEQCRPSIGLEPLTTNFGNGGRDQPDPFVNSITVTRVDGGSDDCGDPPAFIPAPVPRPRPIIPVPSFTWIDVDLNTNIQNDFHIRIGRPTLNINNDFYVPIDIDLVSPSLNIENNFSPSLTLNVSFSGTINIGGPSAPGKPPDDPVDDLPDPDPIPVPDPPPDPDEPPDTPTLLYGAICTAVQTDPSRVTTVQLDSISDLYAPDAGTVAFVYREGSSTFFGRPMRVQWGKQSLYADNEFTCVDVLASPRPGWTINISKLERSVPEAYLTDRGY
jgi:hypothetical protein